MTFTPPPDSTPIADVYAVIRDLVADTGWIAGPAGLVTSASGWNVTSVIVRRFFGVFVGINVIVERTGGTITVPADGNVSNQLLATVTDPDWLPAQYQPLVAASDGRVVSGYIGTTGNLTLSALGGTGNIGTGFPVQLSGIYAL